MSNGTLTPQPVCPHCGHVEHDAWEMNFGDGLDGDGTFSCASCGDDFFCSREVTVYYTTAKVAP